MFYCALHNCYGLYGCRVCQRELTATHESATTNAEGANAESATISSCPQCEEKDMEIERLKGLLKQVVTRERSECYQSAENKESVWQQFKSQNNL